MPDKQPYIIAVTGKMAAGKSRFVNRLSSSMGDLKKRGAKILIVRMDDFGEKFFSNPALSRYVNLITYMERATQFAIERASKDGYDAVILDSYHLAKLPFWKDANMRIVVSADANERFAAAQARDEQKNLPPVSKERFDDCDSVFEKVYKPLLGDDFKTVINDRGKLFRQGLQGISTEIYAVFSKIHLEKAPRRMQKPPLKPQL